MKTLLAILSILVFASFNVDEVPVEIPTDLDTETIIFSKACLMNMVDDWPYPDSKKEVSFWFKKCTTVMQTEYPFKYKIIEAVAEIYNGKTSFDRDSIVIKEVSKPEADVAKYEFKFVDGGYGLGSGPGMMAYFYLMIIDRKTNKAYKVLKKSYEVGKLHTNLKKVIEAIKKKYGK